MGKKIQNETVNQEVMEEKAGKRKKAEKKETVVRKIGPVSIELNPTVDKYVGYGIKGAKVVGLGLFGYCAYKLGFGKGVDSVEPVKLIDCSTFDQPDSIPVADVEAETIQTDSETVEEPVGTY